MLASSNVTSLSTQPLLSFQVRKKHLIKDAFYVVSVFEDRLQIGKTALDPNPKYKVELSLNLKVDWQFTKQNNKEIPIAFGILYLERLKWFFANEQDLQKFKATLGNKVFHSNIVYFFFQGNIVASGSTSQVCLVIEKSSVQILASKCIAKTPSQKDKQNTKDSLFQEIRALQLLTHENLLSLVGLYEGKENYYLVTDYLDGGNLSTYIHQTYSSGVIPVCNIQAIMRQVLRGLDYMHSKGYMHRDIKPENIMFKVKNDIGTLKIVDFGLATRWDLPQYLHPKCGTPGYVAPEIAQLKDSNQTYTSKCDVFSAGVILFKMFTRKDVFPGANIDEIYKRNKDIALDITPLHKYNVPKVAQDLILKLLEIDPQKRYSAAEALAHPFLQKNGKQDSMSIEQSLSINNDPTAHLSQNFNRIEEEIPSQPLK